MTYGLTPEGFIPKPLQVIREELNVEYKGLYGNDLDVEADSSMGQWIGTAAKREAHLWELMEELYASRDPSSAVGNQLDNACQYNGVTRLKAMKTYAPALVKGKEGTTLEKGRRIKQSSSFGKIDFILRNEVVITQEKTGEIFFIVSQVQNNTAYEIILDGTSYSYTSSGAASQEAILQGLYLQITELWKGTCVVVDDAALKLYNYDQVFSTTCNDKMKVQEFWSPAVFDAEKTGKYAAPAGTLDTIVSSVPGWEAVKNPIQGITGRDLETDEELRIRRRQSVHAQGNGTDEAIRSGLMQDVQGVANALVFSNRKDQPDDSGRPPHCFEAVVEGGDEQMIAAKIWQKMGSGIQPYGKIKKTVIDSTGKPQIIGFSRPAPRYLWVKITYTKYSEESFPSDGEKRMRQAILDFAIKEFTKGKDVIRQRFSGSVYTVPGIEDITIQIAVTNLPEGSPSFHQNNIPIGETDYASLAAGRILLEVA